MPDEFFTGTTRAGRVLRLFYEHTAYDTFTDETGETFDTPRETKYTATLDDAPIEVEAVHWNSNTATVRTADEGTFTATNTDYAGDHPEALRRYLEHRPSGGWHVEIVDKGEDGDELTYVVSISNDRLSERAEFRLSPQVADKLAKGDSRPTDKSVMEAISEAVRADDWAKIQHRAEHPTTFLWRAY